MSNILFINACVRPNSRTKELAEYVLKKLSGNIQTVNLYDIGISPITLEDIEKRDGGDFSSKQFDFARQFAAADTIVIAAPYWDLLFPSVLRTYLENVCVSGITFKYSQNGMPIGLCNAKKLYYVTTAGGFIGENNYGFYYVKALSEKLFGISEVDCITAEGLDIITNNVDNIMKEAKQKVDKDYEK